MRFPEAEILVMARAPVPGAAKTRLIPALGEEGAAALHASLVERLLAGLCEAAVAPITLCCTPDITHPFFQQCQQRFAVRLLEQQGEGLGERLHYALSHSLEKHRYAVVIGCDIPQLGAAEIAEAINALLEGKDAAITPTEDGGYALLALKRSEPQLFDGIAWGSAEVMSQTRDRLHTLDWSWYELPSLWDVDLPEDLQRLSEHSLPPKILEIVRRRSSPAG